MIPFSVLTSLTATQGETNKYLFIGYCLLIKLKHTFLSNLRNVVFIWTVLTKNDAMIQTIVLWICCLVKDSFITILYRIYNLQAQGMNRQRLTGILKYDTIIFYIKVINEKWLKQQKFHIILYHLK